MSQAEELLASLSDNAIAASDTPSAEGIIVINAERFILVPDSLKRLGVQHDHNIKTVTFDCPRYCDNHDMSLMKIYINYMCSDGVIGQHLTSNLRVEEDRMMFDWTISGHVTHAKGKVSFLVCIVKTDGNGLEERHWNSELNQECSISEGLECEEIALVQYPDIITQLLLRMDNAERVANAEAIAAAVESALNEAKESGEFKGDPGPQGPKGDQGEKGDPGPQGPRGESASADFSQNDPSEPDYIKNRTHWVESSETEITWDGSAGGRRDYTDDQGRVYYKISDQCPGELDVIGATIKLSIKQTLTVSQEMFNGFTDGQATVGSYIYLRSAPVSYPDNTIDPFSVGVYAAIIDGVYPTVFRYGKNEIHTLDEKFIPDTIARRTELQQAVGEKLSKSGFTPDKYLGTDAEGNIVEKEVPNSGQNGNDGFSPVATVTQTAEGATITITDKSGTTTATITNGKDGKDGADGTPGEKGDTGEQGEPGKDGTSVTHRWDGTILSITSASGTSSADLKGDKGDKGDTGAQGAQGIQGEKGDKGDKGDTGAQGAQGIQGEKGDKGDTGAQGAQGIQGPKGDKGDKGDTGATGAAGKDGSDYVLTEADKVELVAMVIEMLGGNPVFGYVDSDTMTIVLQNAPDGQYSLAYIKDDGTISAPIGSMEKDTRVYYTVTNTLTNCTNSNSAKKAVQGEPYSATITANSGYELKSVTVTMGGNPVSVSGGTITIANVTGNIVITAAATEAQTGPTNFANPNDTYWKEGYRLSISSGGTSACEGRTVTNFIPAVANDVLRVKGLDILTKTNNQNSKIVMYSKTDDESSKLEGLYGATTANKDSFGANVAVDGDVSTLTLLYGNEGTAPTTLASMKYIRIDGILMDGYTPNDVIITINEEIV